MLLYLVRHGETDWNLQRRIQGSTDIPLNDTGREQAAATGRLLARREWDAIYSSPLSRAIETGELIAREVGLPGPTRSIAENVSPGGRVHFTSAHELLLTLGFLSSRSLPAS